MFKSLKNIFTTSSTPQEQQNNLMAQIDPAKIPKHVAIIMDGNGRWASRKGLPRGLGHRAGVESLRRMVKLCSKLGINYLTVYAFSTENWKRPQEEVNILMDLLVEYLNKELKELNNNQVCIKAFGEIQSLPSAPLNALVNAMEMTKGNTGLQLNLCLNYGGRMELTEAVKQIAQDVLNGKIDVEQITDKAIEEKLYTHGIPDPDLLIRPSGEMRVSNYLLWQIAYTEFWLTDTLWPDFREEHLLQAVIEFQHRERRFGGLQMG